MIEKTSAFKVGEFTYCTLFDAKRAAVYDTLYRDDAASPSDAEANLRKSVIEQLISKSDEVIAILQMEEGAPRGRKPRSDQGKPHAKRKAKAPVEEPSPGIKVEASEKYAGK